MEVLGVFIFAGGAFGALFFHQYADGYKPYLIIRNFLIAVAISGLIVFAIGLYRYSKMPIYEYKVSAHYIDGSTKTLLFDSKYDPKINAARGTYWIEYGAYTVVKSAFLHLWSRYYTDESGKILSIIKNNMTI